MEKPQKTAAIAEAERNRGFRLENKRRIVELQLLERILEVVIIGTVHGIEKIGRASCRERV